jgi:prophage regulatory protein
MSQHQEVSRILRRQEVEQRTGLSRSTLYAKMSHDAKRPALFDPAFPRPVRLGARAVGWLEKDIDDWLASRAPAR